MKNSYSLNQSELKKMSKDVSSTLSDIRLVKKTLMQLSLEQTKLTGLAEYDVLMMYLGEIYGKIETAEKRLARIESRLSK